MLASLLGSQAMVPLVEVDAVEAMQDSGEMPSRDAARCEHPPPRYVERRRILGPLGVDASCDPSPFAPVLAPAQRGCC